MAPRMITLWVVGIYCLAGVVPFTKAQVAERSTATSQEDRPFSELIFQDAEIPSCHASTIAETDAGLVAAWFGGTREKDPDVEIYVSFREDQHWSDPVSVADGVQDDGTRYPCWNPVLFQMPQGPLLLFYKVGPDPMKWWGEWKSSTDGGRTWSEAKRLPDGILGPVKNKPVLLQDGRLLCASSTESHRNGKDYWQVHLESTGDGGKTWKRSQALNDGLEQQAIQPSILQHPDGQLQMICRSRQDHLMSLWSEDQGKTWQKMQPLNVPNPNSGTDAVTLQDGRHLLVYNPTTTIEGKWGGPRTPLRLAISSDGYQWKDLLTLEDQPGEYSYPAVIQGADGTVHLTYTWKRQSIKYWSIPLSQF